MSDLSQDWCELCGNVVAGVLSGLRCQIVYIQFDNGEKRDTKGVCLDCVKLLIEARNKRPGRDLDEDFVYSDS